MHIEIKLRPSLPSYLVETTTGLVQQITPNRRTGQTIVAVVGNTKTALRVLQEAVIAHPAAFCDAVHFKAFGVK